jgi:hypothetical protein
MSNHVHLLLRTGRVPLSTVMRRLLKGCFPKTVKARSILLY